jgi:hypothetical protein
LIGARNLRYFLRRPETRMDWWYTHLGSMIGTGIAGYTAFLVFGGAHLFPAIGRSEWRTIFWVLPTMIGGPAIFAIVGYYRRKFSGGRSAAVAAPAAPS